MQVAFSSVTIFVRSRQKGFLRDWGLVNRKDSFSEPFSRLLFSIFLEMSSKKVLKFGSLCYMKGD